MWCAFLHVLWQYSLPRQHFQCLLYRSPSSPHCCLHQTCSSLTQILHYRRVPSIRKWSVCRTFMVYWWIGYQFELLLDVTKVESWTNASLREKQSQIWQICERQNVLHSICKHQVIANPRVCLLVDTLLNYALQRHGSQHFFNWNFKRYQVLHVLNNFLVALQYTFLLHYQFLLESDCLDFLHQNRIHLQVCFNYMLTFFKKFPLSLDSFCGLCFLVQIQNLFSVLCKLIKFSASRFKCHSRTIDCQ